MHFVPPSDGGRTSDLKRRWDLLRQYFLQTIDFLREWPDEDMWWL